MSFAKHETFYIRDGWLGKGIQAITQNGYIFLEDEAPEILGLGKNMVKSLRFWMQAAGLSIEELVDRRLSQSLTFFGEHVRDYDPYQELDGTLWFIHYHLASNDALTTTWYWFFNHFVPIKFSQDEFLKRLQGWINLYFDETTRDVAESSLKKDMDCLIKTYLPPERDASPEDVLESPLTSLGLLSSFTDLDDETQKKVRYFRLESGAVEKVHPLVLLYVLLDAQRCERPNAHQVALQTALREPRNAGRIFNIKPTDFEDVLSLLADRYPDWRVQLTRTGGLDQLTLPNISARSVMQFYYEEQNDAVEEAQSWSRPLAR